MKLKKNFVLMLIVITVVGTATAVYAIYQYYLNLEVEQYSKIGFWNWETGKKSNSFTYSTVLFPEIKTINSNITFGIYSDDLSDHDCLFRIDNLGNSQNIAKLNVTIYNSFSQIMTKEWTDFSSLPTEWEQFKVSATTKYSISIEITGSSGAEGSSSIRIEMEIPEL
jgi:hypothetical protein